MINETLHRLSVGTGDASRPVAVRVREGASPGLFWLGGFKSDMGGTKAAALAAHAEKTGRAIVRFDYSGHGESGGRFEDGTVSRWLEEARAVFETFTTGPQILIGSSMGGWIALLLAREFMQRPGAHGRIAGLVLIAPAADFTEVLMWPSLPEEVKREIEDKGVWMRSSAYGDGPYPITRELIEDGRKHLVLRRRSRPAVRCAFCRARSIPTCPGGTR